MSQNIANSQMIDKASTSTFPTIATVRNVDGFAKSPMISPATGAIGPIKKHANHVMRPAPKRVNEMTVRLSVPERSKAVCFCAGAAGTNFGGGGGTTTGGGSGSCMVQPFHPPV